MFIFHICQYFQVPNKFFCLLWLSNVFILIQMILVSASISLNHTSFFAFDFLLSRDQDRFFSSIFCTCWKNYVMVKMTVCAFNSRFSILHLQQMFYKAFAENSSQKKPSTYSMPPTMTILHWYFSNSCYKLLPWKYSSYCQAHEGQGNLPAGLFLQCFLKYKNSENLIWLIRCIPAHTLPTCFLELWNHYMLKQCIKVL